jgi:hypothetical protein
MDQHLIPWSYRLGIACFAIALAWKALNATGALPPGGILAGQIRDTSF